MKVKLEIELELPENTCDWSDAELRQVLFDEFIHVPVLSHLHQQMKWIIEKDKSCDPHAGLMAAHHDKWADIAKTASWSLSRLA